MANLINIITPFSKTNVIVATNELYTSSRPSLMVGEISWNFAGQILTIESIINANNAGYEMTNNKGIKQAIKNITKIPSTLPKLIWGGTVISGVEMNGYLNIVHVLIKEGKLVFFGYKNLMKEDKRLVIEQFYNLDLNSIEDIKFEDATTIESKVTATRLLALGVFALAAKKKTIEEKCFVNLKWKSTRFTEEIIFGYTGKDSNVFANHFLNKIKAACNETATN